MTRAHFPVPSPAQNREASRGAALQIYHSDSEGLGASSASRRQGRVHVQCVTRCVLCTSKGVLFKDRPCAASGPAFLCTSIGRLCTRFQSNIAPPTTAKWCFMIGQCHGNRVSESQTSCAISLMDAASSLCPCASPGQRVILCVNGTACDDAPPSAPHRTTRGTTRGPPPGSQLLP